MIISCSPLRITLGGGGTDLSSYYQGFGGFLIAAAIDKYVYVNIMRPFTRGIFLKYSQLEHVKTVDQVEHPVIREALRLLDFKTPQIEITTLADIPSGTGLGSSGSFTTALIKALYIYHHRIINMEELARLACEIEIGRLKEPVGKQDQYISAYGGITCFEFHPDHSVTAYPLAISSETLFELEDNLLLFFTGFSRKSGDILKDQDERSKDSEATMLENLHQVKDLGFRSKRLLEEGKVADFGNIMHEHWTFKKLRSPGMSNSQVDEWYDLALKNGAIGGKLVGAGGGGFLLFYAEDRAKLRKTMEHAGLQEVRFQFDFEGTKVILS
jgi:D-glycero-alpha-D-manno-heptose-7-phosphate kinase